VGKVLRSVCLYVCLSARISQKSHSNLNQTFCTRYLWLWLCSFLTAMQQVRLSSGTAVYPYMPIICPQAAQYSTNVASLSDESASARPHGFVRFWASGAANFTKMGYSLFGTPMNRRAKLTPLALSSAEKYVTVQKTNKHTNSNRYIHTLLIGMCG